MQAECKCSGFRGPVGACKPPGRCQLLGKTSRTCAAAALRMRMHMQLLIDIQQLCTSGAVISQPSMAASKESQSARLFRLNSPNTAIAEAIMH
jgi:hypothetical protein